MKRGENRPQGPIDWEVVRARLARAIAATENTGRLSPERARAVLLERARALARPPAIEPSAGETIEVLRFVLANERYAIELRHVVEVARLVDLTRVPGAPDFLLGVLQRRGEVLAAIDLHRLFGIEKKGLTDLSRAIVLGGEQAEFAVLADEVRDVTRLWRETIQKPPASFAGIWRDYVCGVMEDSTIVLDGRALLEDRRLFIDQGNGGSEEKR